MGGGDGCAAVLAAGEGISTLATCIAGHIFARRSARVVRLPTEFFVGRLVGHRAKA